MPNISGRELFLICSIAFGALAAALAEEIEPETSPPPESRVKLSAWIDAGITINPACPDDNQNFGRFFDDRTNEPMLNQVAINLERALAAKPGELDWGFKIQGIVGSDARVTHALGMSDRSVHELFGGAGDELVQLDLIEAYLNLHFPAISEGGLDLKLGKFATLEGAELIDPRTNFFYSHSYIFNFGIPLTHTGALATYHANKSVDVMAGITRGVNTSIEDNNDSFGFHGGIGLNLNEGKVTIVAATHIGPETADNDHDLRYLNAITTTWKINEKLTSITDLNFALDEVNDAKAYGIAQYFTYSINSWLTAGVRGEIFRDGEGFYVISFADNDDAFDALRGHGEIDIRTVSGGRTTYGAITVGVNIKPPVPKPLAALNIRPELRYDSSLNSTHPFNDSDDSDQFTVGIDFIIGF